MEEKEISNIYAIPANYTDSGKLLGGMVEPRNAVETGFLLFLVGAPELLASLPHRPGRYPPILYDNPAPDRTAGLCRQAFPHRR